MKRINIFLLSALFFALTFSSCNKHDDDKTEPEKTTVENNSGNDNTELTPEKVTVTFDILGGTGTAEPQTVEKGTKITLPTGKGLTKEGYNFLGWSLTENGEVITEYTATEKEVKLYAVWEQVIFTVTFDTDGGTGEFATQKIEKGKIATEPEVKPTKNGFIFGGWNYNNAAFDFSTSITADVIVIAKWITIPENCVPGLFSVSENKKIFFAKGNLQYNSATNKFQFAEHQYDIIGALGANTGDNGIRDLFGLGTWLEGGNPMNNALENSAYTWDNTKKTAIGFDWQTLTGNEWCYLFNYDGRQYNLINGENTIRTSKFGIGSISLDNDVTIYGVILLPDDWENPTALSKEFNSSANSWENNTYTKEEWLKMEANGAVFLPAAGFRNGSVLSVNYFGCYWSSTFITAVYVSKFSFGSNGAGMSYEYPRCGLSVRLVRVLQN